MNPRSPSKQVDDTPPRRELDMLLTAGERISMALVAMAIHDRASQAEPLVDLIDCQVLTALFLVLPSTHCRVRAAIRSSATPTWRWPTPRWRR